MAPSPAHDASSPSDFQQAAPPASAVDAPEGLRHRSGPDVALAPNVGPSSSSSNGGGVPKRSRDVQASQVKSKQSIVTRGDILAYKRCLRWLTSIMVVGAVTAMSCLYTLGRLAERGAQANPSSPVPHMLEAAAVHHIGVAVLNLTRSLRFYIGVLGGKELPLSELEEFHCPVASQLLGVPVCDQGSATIPWRMVSFGTTLVLLWESPTPGPGGTTLHAEPHLALRVAHYSNLTQLKVSLEEQLLHFSDLSAAGCHDTLVVQNGWQVVTCRGPDHENIQFWKPSIDVAKALEQARKLWARSASDSRGRDIFE